MPLDTTSVRAVSHRRMSDPAFSATSSGCLRDPHIAPINALVDDLRQEGRGWVPYVAPLYGA